HGDKATPPAREIVGIVGDVRHEGLDTESGLEYYVPYTQAPEALMSLVVRSSVDNPGSLANGLRQAIKEMDKEQYVAAIQPMTKLVAESIATTANNPVSRALKRSEEHTSELQSRGHLVCRLLLEKKKLRST